MIAFERSATAIPGVATPEVSAPVARAVLLAAIAGGLVAGFLATDPGAARQAVAAAGDDLARLLRAMAGIKLSMAALIWAGVAWRLGDAARPSWLSAYALACAAMAAGPGLIWNMAHVGAGAVLLHGGLLAGVLLLWRDKATGRRLKALVAARRGRLAAR